MLDNVTANQMQYKKIKLKHDSIEILMALTNHKTHDGAAKSKKPKCRSKG